MSYLKSNEDIQLTFRLTQYSVKIRSKNLSRLVQKARKASNAEELRPGDPSIVLKVIIQGFQNFTCIYV